MSTQSVIRRSRSVAPVMFVAAVVALLCCVSFVAAELSHPSARLISLDKRPNPLNSKKAVKSAITVASVPGSPSMQGVNEVQTQISIINGCASSDFTTPVTIGTQTFNCLVDSGSTTLAVVSSQCGSNCAVNGVQLSPTYSPDPVGAEDQGQTVNSQYGSGSWSGRTFKDSVTINGINSLQMVVGAIDDQTNFFRQSTCQNTWNQANTYQGILGLAYSSIASPPTESYMDLLQERDDSIPDVFTVQMCTNNGRLWIGGYDSTFMDTTQLAYTPITQQAWYVVSMTDMKVGGVSISNLNFGSTIVDSGTTLLLLPEGPYTAVTSAIQANAAFTQYFGANFFGQSLCRSLQGVTTDQLNTQLPGFTIVLGGDDVTLSLKPVSSYLLAQTDDTGTVYYCSGLMNGGATGGSSVSTILGYAAMNQHTVIFDRANTRIGFAPTKYCDVTPPASTYTSWYVSGWTVCAAASATPNDATTCSQTRTVTCKDSNAAVVADSSCTASTKPALKQSCAGTTFSGTCQGSKSGGGTSLWVYVAIGAAGIIGLCVLYACCKRCCGSGDGGSPSTVHRPIRAAHHHAPIAHFTPLVVDANHQYVGGVVGAEAGGANAGKFVVVPIHPSERHVYASVPAHSDPHAQHHDAASRVAASRGGAVGATVHH